MKINLLDLAALVLVGVAIWQIRVHSDLPGLFECLEVLPEFVEALGFLIGFAVWCFVVIITLTFWVFAIVFVLMPIWLPILFYVKIKGFAGLGEVDRQQCQR